MATGPSGTASDVQRHSNTIEEANLRKSFMASKPVYVVGIGTQRYQPLSNTSYVELGLTATRRAVADAGIPWSAVETSYVGSALLPLAPGRPMLRHMGTTGLAITHVENASATGSGAFRQACLDVVSGAADVSIAIGVDKPRARERAEQTTGIETPAEEYIVPFTHFAMLTNRYCELHGVGPEDIARVAVKNHRNGALNPFAQRQKVRTLEEIMAGKIVSGSVTSLQCCPVGEGAAAVIVASEEGIREFGIDAGRVVRVSASVLKSQGLYEDASRFDAKLTRETAIAAFADAGRRPEDIDLVELHDAFAIEELDFLEEMGFAAEGQAVHALKEGQYDIGGRCAVNASGGLIAMGHPIGPTGIGHINEIVLQLRGEAGAARQHPDARIGLAHMAGVGPICYIHILERP